MCVGFTPLHVSSIDNSSLIFEEPLTEPPGIDVAFDAGYRHESVPEIRMLIVTLSHHAVLVGRDDNRPDGDLS